MRRSGGQAAARRAGRLLHALGTGTLLVVLVLGLALGVLSWRLAQGPFESGWLARRLEAAANAGNAPARLRIGSAALAWRGFHQGSGAPLDIQLNNVTSVNAAGTDIADIPRVEVSLSAGALLLGRLRPRSIVLDHPRLNLLRSEDGSISLDLGGLVDADTGPGAGAGSGAPSDKPGPGVLPGWITTLARPVGGDRDASGGSLIDQLRAVRVRDAAITVIDRQLGATWRAPRADINLVRRREGGLDGTGTAELAIGDQRATLHAMASLEPGASRTLVQAEVSRMQPAALARAAPGLAALAGVETPIALTARVVLGPTLDIERGGLEATVSAGQVAFGRTAVPVEAATLALTLAPIGQEAGRELSLREFHLTVRGSPDDQVTRISASGSARWTGPTMRGALTLDLDRVDFAALPNLWPEGMGGSGARAWVVRNITAGIARAAHVDIGLAGNRGVSDLAVTSATGSVTGEGLTVHWLRPVPPIEHGEAKLRILDPDTLEIVTRAGEQRPEGKATDGPLVIRGGRVRISGLSHPRQFGSIEAEIAGGLAETIALLRNPRLHLLDQHPVPLRDPAGQVDVKLSLQLPFDREVKTEDIAVRALAHLERVHLTGLVAGRDLDDGRFDLDASDDGLTVKGHAALAGIPSQVAAELDFRAGPPAQVLQKVTASGRASAAQLKSAGLDAGPLLSGGTADIHAVLRERRDGSGSLEADADLTEAELNAPPIAWRKAVGSPARLSARLVLDHDRLVEIDQIALRGEDLSVQGKAEFVAGHASVLRLDRLVLGRTEATGVIHFPSPDAPAPRIGVGLHGPVLDLSAALAQRSAAGEGAPASSTAAPKLPGPPWSIDARFSRVLVANGGSFEKIDARAEYDGRRFSQLRLDGQTGDSAPFHLEISPQQGERQLRADVADAGALLRGLDLGDTMLGGRLTVFGTYDDRKIDHPLHGTAELTDFRVRDRRGLGRLLQAMTLYGLVQVASGPGLGFSRLVAPFVLTEDALELGEARAFSPSLGLTTTGRIDLRRNVADLHGTIVPAYFFNSLLGNIPLVGRLFSPEQGGGLFAASYTLRGPLDDPRVSVNPLSALTPGFLRGVFGLF